MAMQRGLDQDTAPFLSGGGEMAARIAVHDWSSTRLGPLSGWPKTLCMTLRLVLNSRFPMFIFWGDELISFYNDAYSAYMGPELHPGALGRSGREVLREIWELIGQDIDFVMRGKGATWNENRLIPMTRNGRVEEVYSTFSYSPIHDDAFASGVGGVLLVCMETSKQVAAGRREDEHVSVANLERDRLAQLFAAAPSFMAVLSGPEHRFTFANQAFLEIIGKRDVVGKAIADVLPDAAKQGYLAPLDEVFRTGQSYTTKTARFASRPQPEQRVDERYLDFVYQPIRDESGEVAGIFIDGVNVTERMLAEQELRHTAALLNAILETTHSAIYVKDEHGRMQLANDAALEFMGRSWSEVKGKTDRETLGRLADAEAVIANDRLVMTSGNTLESEEWIGAPGAPPRLFLSSKSPWRDDQGHVKGIIGVSLDITDRKQAETAALESAAQFETFAQAMANQLWTAMPDGSLDWLNARAAEYSGVPLARLVGNGWMDVVHPQDRQAAVEGWDAARAAAQPYEAEFRLRRADGEYRYHLVRAVPIRRDDGRIFHWIGTNTDIDDHKRTSAKLAEVNANLEKQVVERTAALMAAEESLRQSQKMEAVGQLTGGLAHDFNNLLAGISGSLELLEARVAQGRFNDLGRYINIAQGATNRAAALTHRLLAFSRRQTLNPRPTDMNRLVTDMADLVRRTVGPSITVEVVLAGGLWPTLVDPNQLENALLNLSINARDAMPDGGRLTIETGNRWFDHRAVEDRDVPAGQYVSLCVSDTGAGMPGNVVERAFDPFFTTKPIGEGTGLGLSMIYGFVRQSGGQAKIHSEVDNGTTVYLYLPRYFGSDEGIGVLPDITEAHYAADGETVLVVDDEPTVRMLVIEVLEELGYAPLQAEDGREGLKILESGQRIDLLITDVGLPGGLNGRQLADAALRTRPALKVLFITGYAEQAVISAGNLRPGMHVLTKPFALEALASRIKSIISDQ